MNKTSFTFGAVAAVSSSVVALTWIAATATATATANAQQAPPGGAPARTAPVQVSDANASIAHRFEELARQAVQGNTPAHVRQGAGWLRAAATSDPSEPRYPRLLADALLQLRDSEGALRVLSDLRQLRPQDQLAQLEVIDLYVGRMETVHDKVGYLKDLAGRDTVAAEVRSAAASRAAALLLEKGDRDAAVATIDQALALNPMNTSALAMRYRTLPETATTADRLGTIFQLLQSNPVQPELIRTVAETFADAGLLKESVTWYDYALRAVARMGQGVPPDLALDFAAQLFLNGQPDQAQRLVDELIAAYPENYGALTLRMLIGSRGADDKEVIEKLRVQARNALVNQLAVVRKGMGVADATTRPVNEGMLTLPDLGGDVERWQNAKDPQLKDAYLQAVGDLAWFEVFVNERPAEAEALLNHFRKLAGEENLFAARTAGWILLAQGKVDEAKVKLSAAAQNDPLAALGLIRTYGKDEQEKAKEEAQKLLAAHSGGVIGAILAERLREPGATISPGADAETMRAALAKFPEQWMRIIDNPSAFYALRGDPMKISFQYGEPILARVSIHNTSEYPITIAPEGVVQPLVWIEGLPMGIFRDKVPPSALVERFSEQLVLKPRQGMTLMARLDQGALHATLMANPTPAVTLAATARTNVLTTNRGIAPGPGGYAVEFARYMERGASPLTEGTIRRRLDSITAPNGRDKIRSLSLFVRYAAMLRGAKENQQGQATANELLGAVTRASGDADPVVRAWALHELAIVAEENAREGLITKMLDDQAWQSRTLAMHLMLGIPVDRATALVAPLAESDPHPIVKDLAAATLEVLKLPPTTQPTTQPATQTPAAP
jgi:tetratricopeptide (TPR) repeat protein